MVKFPKYVTTILNLLVLLQLFGYTQAAQDVDKDDLLVNGYLRENESELTYSIPYEVKKGIYDLIASEENTSTGINTKDQLQRGKADSRMPVRSKRNANRYKIRIFVPSA
eukprot:263528_1